MCVRQPYPKMAPLVRQQTGKLWQTTTSARDVVGHDSKRHEVDFSNDYVTR